MFWKKDNSAQALKKAAGDFRNIHTNDAGFTRRATSIVPVALEGSHEIAYTSSLRYHELLISLEGHQRTGCLRVISPKSKSRSAIMMYKGRVVGCIYGAKKIDGHLLQEEAYDHILADLSNPGNVLDAYELPEQLVLAAASLFEGQMVQVDTQQKAEDAMDQALRAVAESKLPGCAVLSSANDAMVCVVYLLDGKIIGLFSAKDGWVKPSYEAAMEVAKKNPRMKVKAAYLPMTAKQQNGEMGFSLTGLADMRRAITSQSLQAVDSFTTIPSEGKIYSDLEPTLGAAQQPSRMRRPQLDQNSISKQPSHNVFAIAP